MAKQRQIFVYDDADDVDIAAWLDAQDNKSAAIRAAIRAQIDDNARNRDALTEQVMRRVLREELARVDVDGSGGVGSSAGRCDDVDPEAGARLDAMF